MEQPGTTVLSLGGSGSNTYAEMAYIIMIAMVHCCAIIVTVIAIYFCSGHLRETHNSPLSQKSDKITGSDWQKKLKISEKWWAVKVSGAEKKRQEEKQKEIEQKNAYLSDPEKYIGEAKAVLQNLQTKAENGALDLPSREEIFKEVRESEGVARVHNELLGVKTTPAPLYLAILFNKAVAYYPRSDENKNFFTFKLLVCHGLEAECGGGTVSLPYGTVQISLEVIALAQNEAELEGVIGHELTHILNEDYRNSKALSKELEDKLEKADNKFAMQKAQGLLFEEHELDSHQQIRADLGAVILLRETGYNPCAYREFGKRFGLNSQRMAALEQALTKSSCEGKLWQIEDERTFVDFKKKFVRIDPAFRPRFDLNSMPMEILPGR